MARHFERLVWQGDAKWPFCPARSLPPSSLSLWQPGPIVITNLGALERSPWSNMPPPCIYRRSSRVTPLPCASPPYELKSRTPPLSLRISSTNRQLRLSPINQHKQVLLQIHILHQLERAHQPLLRFSRAHTMRTGEREGAWEDSASREIHVLASRCAPPSSTSELAWLGQLERAVIACFWGGASGGGHICFFASTCKAWGLMCRAS